jgi:hypothetical protein
MGRLPQVEASAADVGSGKGSRVVTLAEKLAAIEKENALSTRQRRKEEHTGKAEARAEELRPCKAWGNWKNR